MHEPSEIGVAMEKLKGIVRRGLHHTRIVTSGSYPLYRLMVMGAVVASLIQIVTVTVPPSLRSLGLHAAYDWFFLFLQLGGAITILIALYMENEEEPEPDHAHLSLTLEVVGLWLLGTALAVYLFGVIINNAGPPTVVVTWFGVAFLIYIGKRMREVRAAIKELRA
ncbi:hypothetical protein SEA_SKOG_147 [Gordonia phage Skog]|uniref:Uncharacterized protein n=1 Tax=Gordonia phage Skog TaxID=2704033 RepID=A0A6G6XJK9_9CAUD|nr:hypothetical protein KHQ85_gp147 [Gordonia phage Skog]QIG58299.1 hypothetical protein SEA_SKOG_147 [Gordonia phage Skog]